MLFYVSFTVFEHVFDLRQLFGGAEAEKPPRRTPGGKTKYAIRPRTPGIMYLAGIYRREGNQAACSILTREAADCIAHIHPRMPVILPAEAIADWLNPRYDAVEVLRAAQKDMYFRAV